ncbi:MAG TPA: hypothetical protein VH307_31280 [Streptosporangiaceae bacterium]|jgi:hypothetical protein|nr:hypothetical protein [Streptosporangiaceae bacterium]
MAEKGSDALITGLATAAVVYGIYQVHLPTVAGARASSPDNQHLETARKSSTWTAAGVVVGATLLGKAGVGSGFASTVFIMGGVVVIALDFAHRLANKTDNQSGKIIQPAMDSTAAPAADATGTYGR